MSGSEHFAHGFVDGKTPEEIVAPGAVVSIHGVNWPTPSLDPRWKKPSKRYTQAEVDAIVKSAKAEAWEEGVEEGGQYQTDSYWMNGRIPEPQNPYTED